MRHITKHLCAAVIAVGLSLAASSGASALPALQLGPDGAGWSYDNLTQTWVTNTNPFSMNAYANATLADGGDGDYAWDGLAQPNLRAYLVLSAAPMTPDATDVFDITVSNSTFVTSGYGAPPIEDPNSLASHGIFDTYFEIYEFYFDGALMTIFDTQPGGAGSGQGYKETFSVAINSLSGGTTAIHADLFTVQGDGIYSPPTATDRKLVEAFAPFSHDAIYVECAPGIPRCDDPTPPLETPEPGMLGIFGLGLLGLELVRRRRRAA